MSHSDEVSVMSNQERNKTFLSVITESEKNSILSSIASHYATSTDAIVEELIDNDEAEHILDYMIEPHRSAASLLMQNHALRGF